MQLLIFLLFLIFVYKFVKNIEFNYHAYKIYFPQNKKRKNVHAASENLFTIKNLLFIINSESFESRFVGSY